MAGMLKKIRLSDLRVVSLISLTSALLVVYINFMLFANNAQVFSALNVAAGVIALGIPILFKYSYYGRIKKIESMFPRLLRDVTENINAGMTLPQAMRSLTVNDYDALTPYVKEMSAKISWGIPFERILTGFADSVGSSSLKRTVQTIVEAHRSGGTMNTVLEAVADSLREMEKIKKERSASIYSQMINGYMIYFVFLGVMIGLSTFLMPTFNFQESSPELQQSFPELFRSLIVIQGTFTA